MNVSNKIELASSTIELTYADCKYSLWIHNKTLDEHVTISLEPEELRYVGKLLCNVLI